MKKTGILCMMLLFLGVSIFSQDSFLVSATGKFLFPSDEDYKNIYGDNVLFPELKVEFNVFNDFYVWGGYGFLTATGETPVLKEEAKSTQHFISFGLAYISKISKSVGFKIEAGGIYASYKEEALGEVLKDSVFGFCAEGGILIFIGDSFFIQAVIGYISASDKHEGEEIKIGGFNAGVGVGISL